MLAKKNKRILEEEVACPDAICVGGGSKCLGMFADFIGETGVGLIGVNFGVWYQLASTAPLKAMVV